jgi:hypothetical protein
MRWWDWAALSLAGLSAVGWGSPVLAWGSTGHRIIGELAIAGLPSETPGFLRSSEAASAIGELSREPDRWKGAGRTHDADRDPGHFLDLGDDGRVFGGPALAALPATRDDYETALRAVGQSSWKAGYLPYSIIDGWQQLAKDFAFLRVDAAAAKTTSDPAHRAWFLADQAEREALTLRDAGTLSHYVADGSQPLHVTVHFNGWGAFANPQGYTQAKVHGPFEGAFVRDFVKAEAVRAAMPAFRDCACPIERRTADYLAATGAAVIPFYELEKKGGFADADPRGEAFAAERLAAGAAELRDLIILAWRASAAGEVGWTPVRVSDVEAGRIDPYENLRGVD